MAIIGIDDTDSRTGGMCTTWIATEVSRRLANSQVLAHVLVRLNPAIEHKTRGNGAVAIVTDGSVTQALDTTISVIDEYAVTDDPMTNPGVVVAESTGVSTAFIEHARKAIREEVDLAKTKAMLADEAIESAERGMGRGLIGASAAIGAAVAMRSADTVDPLFTDTTWEWIAYREPSAWGTPRSVRVPDNGVGEFPPQAVWDTVDPVSGEAVCVPNSPCPVLFGIRGDDPSAVEAVGTRVESEPVERATRFLTNQGTDAHLRPGAIGTFEDGCSYRVRGTVTGSPETWEGGHVRFELSQCGASIPCLAFAPTGRFRTHVRNLLLDDEIIACGEVSRGSLKLEKFALCRRSLTEERTPRCSVCDRTMKSAGRGQGYRCRDCQTSAPTKMTTAREHSLAPGWYEVPPGARRHLATPIVRMPTELPVFPTSSCHPLQNKETIN